MSCPELPRTASGEVLVICTYYDKGEPCWGELRDRTGDGAAPVPGGGGPVRLRRVADAGFGTACAAGTCPPSSRTADPPRPSPSWWTAPRCTAASRCWWTWRRYRGAGPG